MFTTKNRKTGVGYTLLELYSEGELIIIAGSDTTAVVILAAFFFNLSGHPEIQERLTRDILDTFSSNEDIRSGTTLQGCKYHTAFLQEAMRMAPPVCHR
jgi:cytochrome P450